MNDESLTSDITSEIIFAARALEQGRLVAFPTETVYGLGADAENPAAVNLIYATKGRPTNHPVIVHIASSKQLTHWACDIPSVAYDLTRAFWPGPLTLILKRHAHIPDTVSGGQDSIGLRCPSHPISQALLAEFKGGAGGIAAPSANKFGQVSPTLASHVREEFMQDIEGAEIEAGHQASSPFLPPIACVLEGGQSEVGIESTIVDLTRIDTHGLVILRPGHVTQADIEEVVSLPVQTQGEKMPASTSASATASPSHLSPHTSSHTQAQPEPPRVSGSLDAHYAPRTPLLVVASEQLPSVLQSAKQQGKQIALLAFHDSSIHNHTHSHTYAAMCAHLHTVEKKAVDYAFQLYANLRALDLYQVDYLIFEAPPQNKEWLGVNDRLRRAAFDTQHWLKQFTNRA